MFLSKYIFPAAGLCLELARMFALVFGSRVCEGCVCAATYCVNADSRWVGTQMHNSTLADEEDDILNIEKLTFS